MSAMSTIRDIPIKLHQPSHDVTARPRRADATANRPRPGPLTSCPLELRSGKTPRAPVRLKPYARDRDRRPHVPQALCIVYLPVQL